MAQLPFTAVGDGGKPGTGLHVGRHWTQPAVPGRSRGQRSHPPRQCPPEKLRARGSLVHFTEGERGLCDYSTLVLSPRDFRVSTIHLGTIHLPRAMVGTFQIPMRNVGVRRVVFLFSSLALDLCPKFIPLPLPSSGALLLP